MAKAPAQRADGPARPRRTTVAQALTRAARLPFVARAGRAHREVALTFDDGPGPLSGRFVRELGRLHAGATFFEVGQQVTALPAVARYVHRRFPVGDHTVSHARLDGASLRIQRREIDGARRRMHDVEGARPRLFRPPYGAFDATTSHVTRRAGMVNVIWTVDSRDYTRPGTPAIVSRVLRAARPGVIVLMHDGGGPREQTLAALPAIVHGLRRRGLRPVSLLRLLRDSPPPRHQRLPIDLRR